MEQQLALQAAKGVGEAEPEQRVEDDEATDTEEEQIAVKGAVPQPPGLPTAKPKAKEGKARGKGAKSGAPHSLSQSSGRRATNNFKGIGSGVASHQPSSSRTSLPKDVARSSSAQGVMVKTEPKAEQHRTSERSRSPTRAASVAGTATSGRSQTTVERLRSQTAKYLAETDLSKTVAGNKCGNDLQFMRRLEKACTERPGELAIEGVQMGALVQLCEKATAANVNQIHKLSTVERKSILQELVPKMSVIPVGKQHLYSPSPGQCLEDGKGHRGGGRDDDASWSRR